jgi:DNA-binding transcriptional MerR regulator
MKIGQLSELTGIPTRMLRYYEQQGLLASERSLNGYRSYRESDVEKATRVRALIQSGLSTRMTKIVLDLEDQNERALPAECSAPLAEELAAELAALDSRLSCLTRSRDALARYLRSTPEGIAAV